jgi:hypothetical protein
MKKLTFICFLLTTVVAQSATITAANLTLAEVQSKIATAAHGDTIQLPAGTGTWSGTLQFTNPVSLIGAGTNLTRIIGTTEVTVFMNPATDKPIRLSGITFQLPTSGATYFSAIRFGFTTMFRVDHCKFLFGKSQIGPWGRADGVIDHCTFENGSVAIRPYSDNGASWDRGFQLGTTNAMVVEDCAFVYNSQYPWGIGQHIIYAHEGGRSIFRNNIFWYTADFPDTWTEVYMGEEWREVVQQSTLWVEFYNNQIKIDKVGHQGNWSFTRGGAALVYSNVVEAVSGNVSYAVLGYNCCGFGQANEPMGHQSPSNNFYWANTYNGSAQSAGTQWMPAYAIENTHYWNAAPSAVNGSPAGIFQTYSRLAYPHPAVTAQDRTVYAASLSLADVQAAVAAAKTGDTVIIPAGTIQWNGTLLLTNGITLRGAGTNATRITGNPITYPLLIGIAQTGTDLPVRVTGINLAHAARTGEYATMVHIQGPLSAFRVDHCSFDVGNCQFWMHGKVYGVIDHNSFLNGYTMLRPYGDNTWNGPMEIGTTNNVVIEDNLFIFDGNAPYANEMIYTHEGAKNIIRRNTFKITSDCPIADIGTILGEEYRLNGGVASVMHAEVYDNDWAFERANTYNFMYWRGGSLLLYSNRFNATTWDQGTIGLQFGRAPNYTGAEVWPDDYPWPQMFTNCFVWENRRVGNLVQVWEVDYQPAGPWDGRWVDLNREYWLSPPNATNGNPAGIYSSYQQLAYPHPMVVAQDGGTPAPNGPTASFIAGPLVEAAPLLASFIDTSTGNPTFWLWDFMNDGVHTNLSQNPSFTYTNAGTYSVSLTVTNADGTSTATYTSYITVTNATPPPEEPTQPGSIRAQQMRAGRIRKP